MNVKDVLVRATAMAQTEKQEQQVALLVRFDYLVSKAKEKAGLASTLAGFEFLMIAISRVAAAGMVNEEVLEKEMKEVNIVLETYLAS
jgi:hypothetical protein